MTRTRGWQHDALAADLAAHLRASGHRYSWSNIEIGSWGRPDVLTLKPNTYAGQEIISFEVKVSVADFRSDVTSGKWQKYLAFSQGVTFAVPHGLITKSDLPDGCGLMTRGATAWRTVRKPTLAAVNLPADAAIKLISTPPDRGCPEKSWERIYLSCRRDDERARYVAGQAIRKKVGDRAAQIIANPESALKAEEDAKKKASEILERARAEAKTAKAQAIAAWSDLAGVLGLTPTCRRWEFNERIKVLEKRLSVDGEVAHLRDCLSTIESAIRKAKTAAEIHRELKESNPAAGAGA